MQALMMTAAHAMGARDAIFNSAGAQRSSTV